MSSQEHLPRTLEPEVMDTAQEASDYDAMDHGEVNTRFCADLLAKKPAPTRVLDVGTGTALIPLELCRRVPGVHVEAIDLAEHMLAVGRRNVARAGLEGRIRLSRLDAKKTGFAPASFDCIMSNSIVHHIPEPASVLAEMWRLTAKGGLLFVRDLARPASEARVAELVAAYAPIPAGGRPEVRAMHERQRDLFAASLRAALTRDEVCAMVAPFGIAPGDVELTSDRHWTLAATKSAG
jgi:ubiquinone/menaquinone biosynthesis C-methylase UbiE